MPSFFGAVQDAVDQGVRCLKCHWCEGWVWWPAEKDLTEESRTAGRVFHCFGECGKKEQAARAAEVSK